jgi:hypothetical protein
MEEADERGALFSAVDFYQQSFSIYKYKKSKNHYSRTDLCS